MEKRHYRSNQGKDPKKEIENLKVITYGTIGILILSIIAYAVT